MLGMGRGFILDQDPGLSPSPCPAFPVSLQARMDAMGVQPIGKRVPQQPAPGAAQAAGAWEGGEQAHLHTRHREAKECEEYNILCSPGSSRWEERGLNHIAFPLCSQSISTCNAFPSPPEHLAESKRQISQGFKSC